MHCIPSCRLFLREMIVKPGTLLSKYPLETNLVVTSITTLFQLAIRQHLLGKDLLPLASQIYIFHFKALNLTQSEQGYWNHISHTPTYFQENLQSSYLNYYFCLPNLGSIDYQCVYHCSEKSKEAKTYVCVAAQVALCSYFEFYKANRSNAAVLKYRI